MTRPGLSVCAISSRKASLPLDGGRGLGGHVEDNAVDLGHRVGDAGRDAGQDVVGQARPVGRHRVLGGHGAHHHKTLASSPDRMHTTSF